MRIIGNVPHPNYMITVMQMNDKITIQVEDRLVSQSFAFRDGTGVRDLSSAQEILTPEFLRKIDARFEDMRKDYLNAIEKLNSDSLEDFEII